MTTDDLELPIRGERFGLERRAGGTTVVRLADSVAVGRFELEPLDDGLFVRALCIEPEYRSYGAGSEAVLLFNRLCDAARVPLVHAWAPPNLGLSAYFWIRMGFRPVHGGGPDGGIWFERRPLSST